MLKLNSQQATLLRYTTVTELNGGEDASHHSNGVNPKKRTYKEAGFGDPEEEESSW